MRIAPRLVISGKSLQRVVSIALLSGAGHLWVPILEAQSTTVTLAAKTAPIAAQPGVTTVNLSGSNFPSGTISPSQVTVTLQLPPLTTGPALTTVVSAVTTVFGTTRRITFRVAGPNVTAPTPYLVSISGTTGTGGSFVSGNKASLTINPPASIVSLNPSVGAQGQTVAVGITGLFTDYLQDATQASFGQGISVGGGVQGGLGFITVTSPTTATAQLTIDPTAAVGLRTVMVATGLQQATLVNGFTIVAPTLQSVTPNTGQQGQTLASVALVGQNTNWVQGTTVASFGAGITINALTVNTATSATANITVQNGASLGARTVSLATGAQVVTLTNGFTVTAGTPVLTIVNPNTGQQGQTGESIALTGQFTHWVQGTTVASFGAGITINSLTVNTATSATANITVQNGASLGARTVSMTTGAEVVTLTNGFTVTAGTPVLTIVNPNTGQQGQTGESISLTGQFTHWVQGTTVASFGAGITINTLTVNSSTSATANITVQNGASLGARTVSLTTGAEVASLASGFTVTAGTPVLTIVNPNTGQQGQSGESISLTGQFTHWVQGTTTASFGAGITVATLTINSATSATASLNIDAAAALGARNVTLTTGAEVVTLANGFTVNNGTPVLTIVNPNTGQQGQTGESISLTGQFTHWVQGTTTASFGAGITVATLTINSATSATASLNIDAAAALGARNVTLTTGAEVVTLTNGFTVNNGTPVLTTVNPNTGQQGQTGESISLTGQFTHWVQGTTTASFGAGITVATLTINSATTATASLNIDGAAALGARNVTLTTGAEVVTLTNGFTVNNGTPVLTTVNPNTGQQGQTGESISLTGQFTHWVQGTTTASFGAGITVATLTINSATTATASLNIDAAAALGARNVTLTTGAEVVTLTNGFTVTNGTPVLTIVNPNTGQQGQTGESICLDRAVHALGAGNDHGQLRSGDHGGDADHQLGDHGHGQLEHRCGGRTGRTECDADHGSRSRDADQRLHGEQRHAGADHRESQHRPAGPDERIHFLTGQFTHWVQGTTTASFGAGITVATLTINSATRATASLNIDAAAARVPRM